MASLLYKKMGPFVGQSIRRLAMTFSLSTEWRTSGQLQALFVRSVSSNLFPQLGTLELIGTHWWSGILETHWSLIDPLVHLAVT